MGRKKKLMAVKERGKWTREDLAAALKAIEGGLSIHKAEQMFGVPYSTLRDRRRSGLKSGPKMGRSTVFTPEQEQQMAQEIILLSKLFYGLTSMEVRMLAYEFVVKQNIPHPFNSETKLAGREWFTGFLERNPELSIRKPENISFNRIKAFNRTEVSLFFDNWEKVLNEHGFPTSKIFNMDETGISVVSDSLPIVVEKGQKRVGKVASGERGRNITVICAANAAGEYIPPMFIFPRQRITDVLKNGGPTGAIYHGSSNGYSNSSLFLTWLEHFVIHRRCSEGDPVVIILDNHESHISLESYYFCRDNGIILLSLPPHTSHRMQPLDVSFFGPLKAAYKRESDAILKESKGRKITIYEVASVFRKAYVTVASMQNASSGFVAAGIYPFNRNVFTDDDYLPAEVFEGIDKQTSNEGKNSSHVTDSNVTSLSLDDPSVLQALFNTPGTSLSSLDLNENQILNLDIPILIQEDWGTKLVHTQSPSTLPQNIIDGNPVEQESSQLSESSAANNDHSTSITPGVTLNQVSTHSEDGNGSNDSSSLPHNIQTSSETPKESKVAHANSPSRDSRQSGSMSPAPRMRNIGMRRATIQSHELSEPRQEHATLTETPCSRRSIKQPLKSSSTICPSSDIRTHSPTESPIHLQTPTLITPTIRLQLTTPSPMSSPTTMPAQSTPISHLVKPLIATQIPSPKPLTPQIIIVNMVSSASEGVQMTRETSPVETSSVPKGRKKQHSTILTASPMKQVLETKQSKRIERDEKGRQREKRVPVKKEKENSPNTKKKRVQKSSPPKKIKGPKKVINKNKKCDKNERSSDVNEDEACSICQEYGKDELWFRCRACGKWSHAACVNATDADEFVCDICE